MGVDRREFLKIAGLEAIDDEIMSAALSLGADVPVCLLGRACRIRVAGAQFPAQVPAQHVRHRVMADFHQGNTGHVEPERLAAVGQVGRTMRVEPRAGGTETRLPGRAARHGNAMGLQGSQEGRGGDDRRDACPDDRLRAWRRSAVVITGSRSSCWRAWASG